MGTFKLAEPIWTAAGWIFDPTEANICEDAYLQGREQGSEVGYERGFEAGRETGKANQDELDDLEKEQRLSEGGGGGTGGNSADHSDSRSSDSDGAASSSGQDYPMPILPGVEYGWGGDQQ